MAISFLTIQARSLILVLSFVSGIAFADELNEAEIRSQIENTVSERHPKTTGDWWKSLGPEAPGILISMHGIETTTIKRLRLLQALAWFPESTEAVKYLKDQVAEAPNNPARAAAIRALGASQGEQALDFVAEYLKHREPSARLAAGEAIRGMQDKGSARAGKVLAEYLQKEKTPWLKSRVAQAFPASRPTPTVEKLEPVASSENGISKAFAGQWSGFFIAPEKLDAHGTLRTFPVEVSLALNATALWSGNFSIMDVKKVFHVKLVEITGKGSELGARAQGFFPNRSPDKESTSGLKARLTLESSLEVIRIELPTLRATMVLERRK